MALAFLIAAVAVAWGTVTHVRYTRLAGRYGEQAAGNKCDHDTTNDGIDDGRPPPGASMPIGAPPAALVDGHYIGIMEIQRFEALRARIGFVLADQILAQIAADLQRALPECTLGRIGRKYIEFVFLAQDGAAASHLLSRLTLLIEATIEIDGFVIGLRVNSGAVPIMRDQRKSADHLLHHAAIALLEAQSRNLPAVIGAGVGASRNATPLSIHNFSRAIADNQLQLVYQPKLHCRTDRIHAVEALLRWHHPTHGLVNTQQLIDFAEATGAVGELTKWVVERAVADQRELELAGLDVSIDVNISGSLLGKPEMTDWLIDQLTQNARPMGIEITETATIEERDQAIGNLTRLAEAGVRIAIDDYGTGLSSLVYLKQLPAQELKIDRGFVCGLTESHRDPLIIRSTIDLAHALEMEVTAEGVDDPMAFALLRAMGCDMIQGYLIAKPMPLCDLCPWLASWDGSSKHAPERLGQTMIARSGGKEI